jgi:arsenate reductase
MTVTIYHNPECGTSRNTLAMIRASGEETVVIEYLKHPPSRERLLELAKSIGVPVRGLMREKGTPYSEMKLGDATLSDDELVAAILAKPILLQRPIVETPKGTKICRPSEGVFDLLDRPVASFTKEDGEIVTRA